MTPVVLEAVLGTLLLVYLIAALVREIRRLQRQRMRVRKLYASPVFQDMLPMLEHARRRHLEQVRVDKTGVLITYLFPAGSNTAFLMKPHGYAYLTEEQQAAMRTLLEECLPKLRQRGCYRLLRRTYRLVNGQVEYSYRYVMQNRYKASLVRIPYYEQLQDQPWRV